MKFKVLTLNARFNRRVYSKKIVVNLNKIIEMREITGGTRIFYDFAVDNNYVYSDVKETIDEILLNLENEK